MFKKFMAVFLALIYSFVYTILGPMTKAQDFHFDASRLLPFALCFVLCLGINILIFFVIPRCHFNTGTGRISQRVDMLGDRKFFLLIWLFIFVSWVPAYLILYPGVLSYDILSQVLSALGEIKSNHHPVLHTWLIRVFMKLGAALFSEYEYGLGLLSLLQMLVLSYANARLVLLLKKKNVPIFIVIITAFLSAIWYVNACLSVTMIKDTLHAAFLLLFTCHFTEIVMNPTEYSSQKRNLVFFPIIVFLMCAFRNNGIHIYVFCLAVLLVLRISQIKKARKFYALIIVMLLPIFMYKIYTGPVFEALGIAQSESREALSIPIQQMQRVAINKANELTEEQTELVDYYITDLSWMNPPPGRQYDPFWADPAKSCFVSVYYDEDPAAFWKFYIKIGRQFTKEYIYAFLSNTLGYWYPGEYRFSYVMYEDYTPELFMQVSLEPLERKTIWDSKILKSYYESVCSSEFWRTTPVLRLFFVPGFAIWFLIYALVLAWRKKGFFTNVLPLFLPLIAQYGIMLLSPMSSFRYSWPFYLMLPLTFIAIFGNCKTSILIDKGNEEFVEESQDD